MVEGETHLAQPLVRHRLAQRRLVLGVEEQEPSGTGADELAAERSGVAAGLIPAVDRVAGHPLAALALVLPVHVHQLAEAVRVAGLQRLLGLFADLGHRVEVGEHLLVALLGALLLLGEHRVGVAGVAGEEEQQPLLEVEHRLLGDHQGRHVHAAVALDVEVGQPAEGGDVLVLLSARALQPLDLDVAGLLGERPGADLVMAAMAGQRETAYALAECDRLFRCCRTPFEAVLIPAWRSGPRSPAVRSPAASTCTRSAGSDSWSSIRDSDSRS